MSICSNALNFTAIEVAGGFNHDVSGYCMERGQIYAMELISNGSLQKRDGLPVHGAVQVEASINSAEFGHFNGLELRVIRNDCPIHGREIGQTQTG